MLGKHLSVRAVSLLAAMSLLAGCGTNGQPSGPTGSDGTGPLRLSGGGIAQFREPGGDNSIEEYGRNGTKAELKQAAATVHAYLVARADRDWSKACTLAGGILRRRVAAIVELTGMAAGRSCAERMGRLARGEPDIAQTRYEATKVDAAAIRVDGDTGFIFFNAGGAGRKLILSREHGRWKVGGLLPTPLH
jgi:hypothetical protein